jgi:hypothetical protein
MTAVTDIPISPLRPYAVTLKIARVLLGNKAISEIYEDGGRAEDDPKKLDLIKDGSKTLVTMASIDRRYALLPPAKIKPTRPRARIGVPTK